MPLGLGMALLVAAAGDVDLQSVVQHLGAAATDADLQPFLLSKHSYLYAAGTCIFRWMRQARTWGSNASGDHLLLVSSFK